MGDQFSVEDMKEPAGVARLLRIAEVRQPPCHFCLRQIQKTCGHVVPELECGDYVLYSTDLGKLERKFVRFVGTMHVRRVREYGQSLRT